MTEDGYDRLLEIFLPERMREVLLKDGTGRIVARIYTNETEVTFPPLQHDALVEQVEVRPLDPFSGYRIKLSNIFLHAFVDSFSITLPR